MAKVFTEIDYHLLPLALSYKKVKATTGNAHVKKITHYVFIYRQLATLLDTTSTMRIASHFMNRGGDCKIVCKAATLVGVLICVSLFVSTQVIVIHPPTIVRRKLSAGEIYPAMINNIKPLGVPIDHDSETVTFWRK